MVQQQDMTSTVRAVGAHVIDQPLQQDGVVTLGGQHYRRLPTDFDSVEAAPNGTSALITQDTTAFRTYDPQSVATQVIATCSLQRRGSAQR